jgi:hypothetical protein
MRILAAKNDVVSRLGRPTSAKKLRRFAPDCSQKGAPNPRL